MAIVVPLPNLIAWAPTIESPALDLSAVLVPPEVMLDRWDCMFYLSDRLQNMLNGCDDPQEATADLVRDLWDAGLWPDCGRVPPREAANLLVATNPGVEQRLASWNVLPGPPTWRIGPTVELPEARAIISNCHYDPASELRAWAGWLSQLP